MSTDQDVEALAVELRERDIARQLVAGGPGAIASADTPRTTASDVIDSDWLAGRLAQARREFVEKVARNWQGGTGHTDANKWVSIADLRARAEASR